MAPLKFEDNIKDKLDERTIQPSNDSWVKLEQKLEANPSQKNSKNYWWLGIAASLIGFLIITTIFVNSEKVIQPSEIKLVEVNENTIKENQSKDVVEQNVNSIKTKKIENHSNKENIIEPIVVESGKKKSVISEKKKDSQPLEFYNDKKTVNETALESIAIEKRTPQDQNIEENKSLQIKEAIIESKVAGVIAEVQKLEKSNKIVSDEEIEALLRKAQNEITNQEILKSNTVNASALLLDVETELDESFKERVFEALKTGFEKLKTTVVQRDN